MDWRFIKAFVVFLGGLYFNVWLADIGIDSMPLLLISGLVTAIWIIAIASKGRR